MTVASEPKLSAAQAAELGLNSEITEEQLREQISKFKAKGIFSALDPDEFIAAWKRIVPVYEPARLDQIEHMISMLLLKDLFWATVSLNTAKVFTRSIPTLGVTFNGGQFVLMMNPDFLGNYINSRRNADVLGLLKHEFGHIVLGHLGPRTGQFRASPEELRAMSPEKLKETMEQTKRANWAADSAINSMLEEECMKNESELSLPGAPIVPGLRPGTSFNQTLDPHTPAQLLQLASPPKPIDIAVMTAQKCQSYEYYFARYETAWGSGPDGDNDMFGDHSMWMTDDQRAAAAEESFRILKRAVETAEARGWGNVGESMRSHLRRLVSREIDWESKMRRWIGLNGVSGRNSRSRRRVDRKYPLAFPGVVKGRGARIAVAIDQSGSVYDLLLERLLGVIAGLSEVAQITLIPFDTEVCVDGIEYLNPGDTPTYVRKRCGGTDFNAPVNFMNEPKNLETHDVLIIATDGEADIPGLSQLPRAWLLAPGKSLMFETDDEVITLSDEIV